jgi:hypothetical protein
MPRRAAARQRVLLCALRRVLLCALLVAVCGVAAQSEAPPAEAQKARRSNALSHQSLGAGAADAASAHSACCATPNAPHACA